MSTKDNGGSGAADEFAAFEAAGDVEIGKPAIETNQEQPPEKKPAARRAPPKPAAVVPPVDDKEPKTGEEDPELVDEKDPEAHEDDDEPVPRKTKTPSERIRELNKRLRQEERLRLSMQDRLDRLEKQGLPGTNSGAKPSDNIGTAPDPLDAGKYPLGHLDDRYIEDKLEWLATKKAAIQADAVLQRQQENEQTQTRSQQHAALLEKVDDLATRGAEQFDDFQDAVVEAGMRGDWRLDQPTFEAAHEADYGAQILYELSQDKKEAARVASLTPYGQLKFVMDRNAEISKGKQPRLIPGAGAPPTTQTRGANSRTKISPTTDNLDDFEKAWEADAKGKR